jgi:Flp pilus assembly protein TadG
MNRNARENYMNYGGRVWHLRKAVACFRISRSGIAAVEFAFIAPVMLLFLLGTFEVSQAIAAKRKAVLTASTVASIVTQYTNISAGQTMPDILNASAAVLTPFSAANAIVTVSCIKIDAQGKATILWSQALPSGGARTVGQVVTVPAALDVPNTSLIFGETTYSYTPDIDFMKFGTSTLYSSVYMLPRSGTTVTLGS